MLKITDEHNRTPNVFHFHGMNIDQLPKTFEKIFNECEVDANYDRDKLAIVSTWTDDDKCCLYQQCKKFDIPLINCVPSDYDRTQPWYMPNKIHFFINTLKSLKQKYVMFLDGYDVLISGLGNVIERFESQPYRILFGPSCNNYPDMKIDFLYGRSKLGIYRYFNAGCCMGHREDLLRFYKESLEYINIENPLKSEQFILRNVFGKYSYDSKQTFVNIDSESLIFRSMGVTDSKIEDYIIRLRPNREVKQHYVYLGVDGMNTNTDLFFSLGQVEAIGNLYKFIDETIRLDDQLSCIFISKDIGNNKRNKVLEVSFKHGVRCKEYVPHLIINNVFTE